MTDNMQACGHSQKNDGGDVNGKDDHSRPRRFGDSDEVEEGKES
eukprot:CAMPEP_0184492382 /NCGR_PEP_ID=MMETSP0113_2-20130426/23066_1 /TAXON_ID=91329 /ORGANISM="Norrisiella sphaerica, Strain BC52" /LENGTH=43 /DNA_ID= /DNA_START= /DNA_END= /DNA_ORIENTATION=